MIMWEKSHVFYPKCIHILYHIYICTNNCVFRINLLDLDWLFLSVSVSLLLLLFLFFSFVWSKTILEWERSGLTFKGAPLLRLMQFTPLALMIYSIVLAVVWFQSFDSSQSEYFRYSLTFVSLYSIIQSIIKIKIICFVNWWNG